MMEKKHKEEQVLPMKNMNVNNVDWVSLSEMYEKYMEVITDNFYKLTDKMLKNTMLEKIKVMIYLLAIKMIYDVDF